MNLVYKPITDAVPLENIKLATVVDFLSYLLIKGQLVAVTKPVAWPVSDQLLYEVPQGYTLFIVTISTQVYNTEQGEGLFVSYQGVRFFYSSVGTEEGTSSNMTFSMPLRLNAGEQLRCGQTYTTLNVGQRGQVSLIGYLINDTDYKEFRK